jgi:integrase
VVERGRPRGPAPDRRRTIVIQRQLGHSNLGITSVYLQGIDNAEIMRPSTPAARQ